MGATAYISGRAHNACGVIPSDASMGGREGVGKAGVELLVGMLGGGAKVATLPSDRVFLFASWRPGEGTRVGTGPDRVAIRD